MSWTAIPPSRLFTKNFFRARRGLWMSPILPKHILEGPEHPRHAIQPQTRGRWPIQAQEMAVRQPDSAGSLGNLF